MLVPAVGKLSIPLPWGPQSLMTHRKLDPVVVAVAFFFSALVGVVFGFFPARKAARLDPIEALRHE